MRPVSSTAAVMSVMPDPISVVRSLAITGLTCAPQALHVFKLQAAAGRCWSDKTSIVSSGTPGPSNINVMHVGPTLEADAGS